MKKSLLNDREETLDTLFDGRLKVLQKKSGYRFSIDALLLAHFADMRPRDRIIDLGTGCGIIPLILIFRRKAGKVIGVETQPSLAGLARRNAALNRQSGHITIVEEDLKKLGPEIGRGTFDLVITNPPYREVGSGRINPHSEKALARHEIKASLEDVLWVSHQLLKDKGRLTLIYPASRTVDLIQGLRRMHLEPKRLQFIHSRLKGRASLVLMEACKEGHPQLQVLSPFFLYDPIGHYTPEAEKLFR